MKLKSKKNFQTKNKVEYIKFYFFSFHNYSSPFFFFFEEEKIGQMTQINVNLLLNENSYQFNETAVEYWMNKYKVGRLKII